MGINLCCPDILDIDAVIQKNPLPKCKGMKRDHLLFIIHSLMQQRACKDDEQLNKIGKKNGFVPLHSKILQSKVPNYHSHIKYLEQQQVGIIECDNHFVPGKVSMGYRLTSAYSTNNFKFVTITDYTLCRKIKADKPFSKENLKTVKEFPYLARWFKTKKLEIDEIGAYNRINQLEKVELEKINNTKYLSCLEKVEAKENLTEKCKNFKILVSRIQHNDYFFHKDETGNRLHTNLTNLPKWLREFLTYDGQSLVSIDIKNSQPYLSTALLKKEFWQAKITAEKPTLKRINKELYEEIKKDKQRNNYIIKLVDSSKTPTVIDFQKHQFIQNVVNGTFYEFLIHLLEGQQGFSLGKTDKEKREKVKKMIFTVLFDSKYKSYNQKSDSLYQMFKKQFPSISLLFEHIKTSNYKNLAILLQRIESSLILHRICKKIANEKSSIPIFTIHDSIATTVGNEHYVQSVMKDELEKAIGIAPKFSIEYWQKQQARKTKTSFIYQYAFRVLHLKQRA
jgi:hypothetical protein